jgi:hypothetical protein
MNQILNMFIQNKGTRFKYLRKLKKENLQAFNLVQNDQGIADIYVKL